jgi:uncharacterized protein (DUF1919 family)
MEDWDKQINEFIELATQENVRMLLVGGGAVNFYGYQRHSADVDFWIEVTDENLQKLITVFQKMDYSIQQFPKEVKEQNQNISIKFSPVGLNLELITRFSVNKTFEEAWNSAETVIINSNKLAKYKVLNYEDLVTSKIKSARHKDLLDIQELERIRNSRKSQ